MTYVYQMTYSPLLIDTAKLIQFLTSQSLIVNWRAPGIPGTLFFVSEINLADLNTKIVSHMSGNLFILSLIMPEFITGWLDPETWRFVQTPSSADKPVSTSGLLGNHLNTK